MRKILFSILASVLLAFPVVAGPIDVNVRLPSPNLPIAGTGQVTLNGGSLLTGGDFVIATVSGATWASVKVAFGTNSGGMSVTVAYSNDGGVNYLTSGAGAPYLKQLNSVTANPPVIGFGNTSPSSFFTGEFPLAANVTNVKITSLSTNAAGLIVAITGFQLYVPGAPVTAVLYDTSALITGANGTQFDVSGWKGLALGGTDRSL